MTDEEADKLLTVNKDKKLCSAAIDGYRLELYDLAESAAENSKLFHLFIEIQHYFNQYALVFETSVSRRQQYFESIHSLMTDYLQDIEEYSNGDNKLNIINNIKNRLKSFHDTYHEYPITTSEQANIRWQRSRPA